MSSFGMKKQKSTKSTRVKKYDISSPQEGKAPFRNSDIELTKDAPEVDKYHIF